MKLLSLLLTVSPLAASATVSTGPAAAPLIGGGAGAVAAPRSASTPQTGSSTQEMAESPPEEGWDFLLKPYLFAYGLKGSVGTGTSVTDIDAEFTDLLDALNFGGMLQLEASPPASRWTALADLMYAQIEDEGLTPGPVGVDVEAKIDEFVGEFSAAYGVVDEGRLEVVGGVRYWNVSGDLEADAPGGKQEAEGSEDWFDPLLGARSRLALGSQLELLLRGDVGGFGVGSDIAFNLSAELGWTLSQAFQIALGYRYMDVDYEDEGTFDMTQAGPTLGLAIRL